jgi:hypothetical protein
MVTAVAESKAPASSSMAEIIAIIPMATFRSLQQLGEIK